MKTILYVETGSGFGGSATCLSTLLRHLNAQAYRPLVACYGQGPAIERIRAQGIAVFPMRRRRAFQELVRLIRGEAVDLVHANNEIYSHAATILAARLTARSCLMHMRGIRKLTRMERLLALGIDQFVMISEAGRRFYLQDGLPPQRCVTVHDGLDVPSSNGHPDTARLRESLGVSADDLVVGMVSRLVPKKGHRDLIRAIACLQEAYPRLHAVIVGGDPEPGEPYRQALEAEVRSLGLAGKISFAGWRDDILSVNGCFDVAVQPSQYVEGLCAAVAEAMAAGKPLVATCVGGIPELVEDGKTGLLIEPQDPDALAAALRRLLDDATLRQRFGQAGRKRIEESFDQRRLTRDVESIYERLLSRRGRS